MPRPLLPPKVQLRWKVSQHHHYLSLPWMVARQRSRRVPHLHSRNPRSQQRLVIVVGKLLWSCFHTFVRHLRWRAFYESGILLTSLLAAWGRDGFRAKARKRARPAKTTNFRSAWMWNRTDPKPGTAFPTISAGCSWTRLEDLLYP